VIEDAYIDSVIGERFEVPNKRLFPEGKKSTIIRCSFAMAGNYIPSYCKMILS